MSYFDKCCGQCRWHKFDHWDEVWLCENEDSDNWGCSTEYKDTCEDYEEKR